MKFAILIAIAVLGLLIPLLWITGTLTAAVYMLRQKMGCNPQRADRRLRSSTGADDGRRRGYDR